MPSASPASLSLSFYLPLTLIFINSPLLNSPLVINLPECVPFPTGALMDGGCQPW